MLDPPLTRATRNRAATDSHPVFTPTQGRFLAFIYTYRLVNGRPPAEADIPRFFRTTPPPVRQMVVGLERAGWILRKPGVARSIAVLVDRHDLPELEPGYGQPVNITVTRHWQSVGLSSWLPA